MAKQSLKLTRAHRELLRKAGIKPEFLCNYRYLTVNREGTFFVRGEGTPDEVHCMVNTMGKLVFLG